MILLDTNVLSAIMSDRPDEAVIAWLDAQAAAQIWTTAVNVFEVRYGLGRLAKGRKRDRLEAGFDALINVDLGGRIAPLDRDGADAAEILCARREAAGRHVAFRDTLIGGIALARRATIATRNIKHFSDLDVQTINPWDR